MTKKRGWLTGKFAPLHAGHTNFIQQAATLCDELTVVLSHNANRFDDPKLALKTRLLYLRQTFKDIPHIKITFVDETDAPEYPNGWAEWAALIKGEIGEDFQVIFTSEEDDVSGYNDHFGTSVHVIDSERRQVPISGTEIRANPGKHWSMMPSLVRQQYLKKVCIVGQESTGKSTLTKYLAKHFQTSWVEEYGRTFCEQDLCGDEFLLKFDDYGLIAARRYEMELQAAKSANRVLFSDTNAAVTNYFCVLYEGRPNEIVTQFSALEKYDLIIFLEADVDWVDDGLRRNPHNRDNDLLQLNIMEALYGQDKIVRVSGTYHQRLTTAIELVEELLQ